MKKLVLLVALFSTIGLQAQIVLTQNEMPGIGDAFIQLTDTNPGATLQQTVFANGNDYTWDFSALAAHDTVGINFIDATTTPYASYFPTADMSLRMGDSTYAYFNVDASVAEIMGLAGYYDTIAFQMIYADPDIIYEFPYTLGTSFQDTYAGSFTAYLGIDPGIGYIIDSVRVSDSHAESQTVIGWGTATTAMGNFDVVKTEIIDTTITKTEAYASAFSIWVPYSTDTTIYGRYQWNMRNTGLPLIEAEYSIDPSDSVIYSIDWLFVSPILSVDENSRFSLKLFPNPTSDVLHITLPSMMPCFIRITDAQGRIIMQGNELQSGKVSIPVSFLENGVYFVSAIIGNEVLGTKSFIKD
jgi:hypothetical protein